MVLYFVSLKKSPRKDKKFMITFLMNNKQKIVHFGASGYMDYTLFKDLETANRRKKAYLNRHKKDRIYDPITPGALSYWILWNKRTVQESLKDYLKRFNIFTLSLKRS